MKLIAEKYEFTKDIFGLLITQTLHAHDKDVYILLGISTFFSSFIVTPGS